MLQTSPWPEKPNVRPSALSYQPRVLRSPLLYDMITYRFPYNRSCILDDVDLQEYVSVHLHSITLSAAPAPTLPPSHPELYCS